MSTWRIPENLLVENGGDIIREEHEDGSVSYRPQHVKYGVGSYTGSGMPDMSRKPERAGQTFTEKEFELVYDRLGYCIEAVYLPNKPVKKDE